MIICRVQVCEKVQRGKSRQNDLRLVRYRLIFAKNLQGQPHMDLAQQCHAPPGGGQAVHLHGGPDSQHQYIVGAINQAYVVEEALNIKTILYPILRSKGPDIQQEFRLLIMSIINITIGLITHSTKLRYKQPTNERLKVLKKVESPIDLFHRFCKRLKLKQRVICTKQDWLILVSEKDI